MKEAAKGEEKAKAGGRDDLPELLPMDEAMEMRKRRRVRSASYGRRRC